MEKLDKTNNASVYNQRLLIKKFFERYIIIATSINNLFARINLEIKELVSSMQESSGGFGDKITRQRLNEVTGVWKKKLEISKSNLDTFIYLNNYVIVNDISDIVTFMSGVEYVRKFEIDFLRRDNLGVKYVDVVIKGLRYFLTSFEIDRSTLDRFGDNFIELIRGNCEVVRRIGWQLTDFTELDLWNDLDDKLKLQYSGDITSSLKLYRFDSPFAKKWVDGDCRNVKIITFHKQMSINTCFCGDVLTVKHIHDFCAETRLMIVPCSYNKGKNIGCHVCEVTYVTELKRIRYDTEINN